MHIFLTKTTASHTIFNDLIALLSLKNLNKTKEFFIKRPMELFAHVLAVFIV